MSARPWPGLGLVLVLVLGMLLFCAMAWAAGGSGADVQTLATAHLSPDQCQEGQGSSRPITLPDDWRAMGLPTPGQACYEWVLTLPYAPSVPWALRMDRLPGNHRITVNGVPLRTHHMDGLTSTSMGTQPYLIEVPASILHTGDNTVRVDVRMGPFRKPGLSPLQAGPLEDMQADFDRWTTWTVDLPRTINFCGAGIALFLMMVWRVRPTDKRFGYFYGLMVVMCARNGLYMIEITTLPIPVMDWLLFTSQALGTYYLAGFGLSYAEYDLKKVMWLMRLMGFGLPLVALTMLSTGSLQLRLIAYPVMILCRLIVVVKVVQKALRQDWPEAIAMSLGPIVMVISLTHDYLFLTSALPVTDLYWTPYTIPVIFLGYAITLMRHFVDGMLLAERMNISLEERVTERTRALESANLSKTRFLAAASHDLRQPTAAIGLLVSLLRQQPSASSETRELTNMLDEAVASMESLLVGLLDISRLDAGAVQPQFQAVSLQDVFQAVRVHEQSAAEAKGLSLRFRMPRDLALGQTMLMTDPMLLHSVLRNLLANAIRYTQRGGVLVAVRRRGPRRIRIEIWDTGIGIATDQLDHIFEEFYQVGNAARDRSRGIGLGLAIVRRTASVLGEDVTVRSRLGKGSVFAIELPLHHAPRPREAVRPLPAQPLLGRTLWLVEDDQLLRRAMAELFQNWGAQVRHWQDGEALLGELSLVLGLDHRGHLPDALVTDYRLPGVDGVSLSQALALQMSVQGLTIPTLIVSGDTDPDEIARLSACGMQVLAKPFRSERLLSHVLALLQPPQAAPLST